MHDLDDLDLTSLRKASRSVVLFHNYRSISYNTVLIAPSIDTLSFCVAVEFFIRHEQELSFFVGGLCWAGGQTERNRMCPWESRMVYRARRQERPVCRLSL